MIHFLFFGCLVVPNSLIIHNSFQIYINSLSRVSYLPRLSCSNLTLPQLVSFHALTVWFIFLLKKSIHGLFFALITVNKNRDYLEIIVHRLVFNLYIWLIFKGIGFLFPHEKYAHKNVDDLVDSLYFNSVSMFITCFNLVVLRA